MYTVAELARSTAISPYTVRYYTRIGLLRPTRHPRNGYKIYGPEDARRLRFIASAKELGFTIAEIEEILDHAEHNETPCPMVREVVERRIDENREKIRELQRLQKRLLAAANMWAAMDDEQPNGHSVCRLIESFSETNPA